MVNISNNIMMIISMNMFLERFVLKMVAASFVSVIEVVLWSRQCCFANCGGAGSWSPPREEKNLILINVFAEAIHVG